MWSDNNKKQNVENFLQETETSLVPPGLTEMSCAKELMVLDYLLCSVRLVMEHSIEMQTPAQGYSSKDTDFRTVQSFVVAVKIFIYRQFA